MDDHRVQHQIAIVDRTAFARGDDVELAQRAITDIGRAGGELVVSSGWLYYRRSSGDNWCLIPDCDIAPVITAYAGVTIGDGPRVVRQSAARVRAIIKLVRMIAPHDDGDVRSQQQRGWAR